MKKFLIILFTCILFIPSIVFAEDKIATDIDVEMIPIKAGYTFPQTVNLMSEFVLDGEVAIKWYESTDGNVYSEVSTTTFDYNKYYKFEITDSIELDEGYECSSYNFNDKSYTTTDSFIIEPFKKYFIDISLDGLEYSGPNEVVDGELLDAAIFPLRGYRLPEDNSELQYNLIIEVGGNRLELNDVYEPVSGRIMIDSDMINGDIRIYGKGREIALFEFTSGDNQKYVFGSGKSLEFIMDADITLFNNQGILYINEKEVDSDYYTVEEGSTKIIFKDELINLLEVGEYTLRAEFYDGEAETKFYIVKEEVGNPNTSDNIVSYIILGIISIITIIGSCLYLKRKRTN